MGRVFICRRTPLYFLKGSQYPSIRGNLRLVLVLGLLQYFQALLHRFPDWRASLRGAALSTRLAIHFALMGCFGLTLAWTVRWVGVHFGFDLLGYGPLRDYQDFGLFLIMSWTVWVLVMALVLCKYSTSPPPTADDMRRCFQNLKTSFVLSCTFIFCRGLVHPAMGFLHAQQELTILTIIIPITYVMLYLVVHTYIQLNRGLVVLGMPVALGFAVLCCCISSFGGPGTVMIVFLHIFSKFVQVFGRQWEDEDEEGEAPIDGSDPAGTGSLRDLCEGGAESNGTAAHAKSSCSNGSTRGRAAAELPRGGASQASVSPVLSPRRCLQKLFTASCPVSPLLQQGDLPGMDLDDSGRAGELSPLLASAADSSQHNSSRCGDDSESDLGENMKRSRSLSDVYEFEGGPPGNGAQKTKPGHSRRWKSTTMTPSQTLAMTCNRHSFGALGSLRQRLRNSSSYSRRELFIRPPPDTTPSSLSNKAQTASTSHFVFRGMIRLSLTLSVVLSLFMAACQIISFLQEDRQWYPRLIDLAKGSANELVIDHARVVKATLSTEGEPIVQQPRYATCDSRWHGFSLVDYALFAELAYFEPEDQGAVLQEFFPHGFPQGKKKKPLMELKVPDIKDKTKHAMFLEVHVPGDNVSVIAIRGTDPGRLSDFIEDMKIWVEPLVFMLLSAVFPTIRIWPDHTASLVITWLHETLHLFGLQKEAQYYHSLLRYVQEVKATGTTVVMTGHSLGGGLARIVASLERLTSVCFSPPGVAQSYRKFRLSETLDRSFLYHTSVSVIPEHDFVPMVDTQLGLVQNIMCSTSAKALQNSCHMLEGTLCDLIKHCGDHRGRFTDCKFDFNMNHLLPVVLEAVQDHYRWFVAGSLLFFIVVVLIFTDIYGPFAFPSTL
ncbi:unnamed protein product [Chrysoparadoxa australica]